MLKRLLLLGAQIANRILNPMGYELQRIGKYKAGYEGLVNEFTRYMRSSLLPDLPETEGRVRLMTQLRGTFGCEALYIVAYLHRTKNISGAVCEFGVAGGDTSALIANEIRATDKTLWLFDTFEGLPKPTTKDILIDDILGLGSMEAYEGAMAFTPLHVKRRLADIEFPQNRTHIIPGLFEETRKRPDLPEAISFAYIDFNFYQPILETLDFLYERMPSGGAVVIDDYGFFSAGAKSAVDEFLEAHPDEFEIKKPPDWSSAFVVLIRL